MVFHTKRIMGQEGKATNFQQTYKLTIAKNSVTRNVFHRLLSTLCFVHIYNQPCIWFEVFQKTRKMQKKKEKLSKIVLSKSRTTVLPLVF